MEIIQISRRSVFGVAFIIVIGFFYLWYRLYTMEKLNIALKDKEIATEFKMLNIVRTSEVSKSMVNLELLKCRGVKQNTLDSMAIKLFYTNSQLIKRDSAFITERYHELHGE